MLLLELPELSCVVLHDDVRTITAAWPTPGDVDLDAALEVSAPVAAALRILAVGGEHDGARVKTRATIRLIEQPAAALYVVPRLLAESGHAPWLRGFAVLERSLGLWLDLRELARGCEHGTGT